MGKQSQNDTRFSGSQLGACCTAAACLTSRCSVALSARWGDTFGVAWAYADMSDDPDLEKVDNAVDLEDGQAVETYYSIAMGSCAFLTLDYQYVNSVSGLNDYDDPVHIAGFRFNLSL